MEIEDKITKVRFNVDINSHIKINDELCETCMEKPCLYVCPVKNFTLNEGKIEFSWQGCLECGACGIACQKHAIEWGYPRGGFGVSFRYA